MLSPRRLCRGQPAAHPPPPAGEEARGRRGAGDTALPGSSAARPARSPRPPRSAPPSALPPALREAQLRPPPPAASPAPASREGPRCPRPLAPATPAGPLPGARRARSPPSGQCRPWLPARRPWTKGRVPSRPAGAIPERPRASFRSPPPHFSAGGPSSPPARGRRVRGCGQAGQHPASYGKRLPLVEGPQGRCQGGHSGAMATWREDGAQQRLKDPPLRGQGQPQPQLSSGVGHEAQRPRLGPLTWLSHVAGCWGGVTEPAHHPQAGDSTAHRGVPTLPHGGPERFHGCGNQEGSPGMSGSPPREQVPHSSRVPVDRRPSGWC
ncbi:proline-rich protein 2-like [Eschrichtius robustus]|uniref:proline-rich protein 2-like n=1 Tax=Eschrichtius robustus TaxID=9764 RepID=UPI0035C0F3A7